MIVSEVCCPECFVLHQMMRYFLEAVGSVFCTCCLHRFCDANRLQRLAVHCAKCQGHALYAAVSCMPLAVMLQDTGTQNLSHAFDCAQFMADGNLETALLHDNGADRPGGKRRLGWYECGGVILLCVARGLAYLHAKRVRAGKQGAHTSMIAL